MQYRPNTIDERVQADMVEYEALRIVPGDVVLDVGGHIGTFASWAYKLGANQVVSVEPDPDNAAQHRKNVNCTLVQAACVSDGSKSKTFYAHRDYNTASGSLISRPARVPPEVPIDVRCVDFQELLRVFLPSVLKVDIEGGEYELDWRLPPCVRAVAIEFHFLPDAVHKFEPYADRTAHKSCVETILNEQGFKSIYETTEERFWRVTVYERN